LTIPCAYGATYEMSIGIKPFSHELKRLCWPLNFKPSGIEKYNGCTNSTEWLEVYQLAIEAVGEDSYMMANYLPICLSSLARTWLMELPTGSVRSWLGFMAVYLVILQ
jgi:hypothetical protein